MTPDLDIPPGARTAAVLLHPHPSFGGNRHHPFVDGLYRRLPAGSAAALRFDFEGPDPLRGRAQVEAALDTLTGRLPGVPVVLVGYSFGAGVAAGVADPRVAGWYLLAPQVEPLSGSPLAADPRPKAIVVPERDQFAPPAAVAEAVAGWVATTVTTAPGTDHFLGPVWPLVDAAAGWVAGTGGSGPTGGTMAHDAGAGTPPGGGPAGG